MVKKKAWWVSKTKWGALLIGLGALAGTVGAYLNGDLAMAEASTAVLTEVGAVLGVMGLRDLPFINKK